MGLRDRALIALMAYTFARIGAAVAMRVEDYFVQGRRSWVRLYEKAGKQYEIRADRLGRQGSQLTTISMIIWRHI
jgi:integrase